MTSNRLDIYKASAGAGKTFTLAHRYIAMMLERTDWRTAYKHILAVTFTNKATEEMKGRILEYLFNLSSGDSKEMDDLAPFLGYDRPCPTEVAAEVQQKSAVMLKNILHDYSDFSVTTIDKFFQHVYRSFSRELGHYSACRVELDQDSLIGKALDEMLMRIDSVDIGNPDPLFEAVRKFALDLLRLKCRTDYTGELAEFASLFKKEDFFLKKKEASWNNPADVAARAESYIQAFEVDLKSLAKRVVKAVNDAGLSLTDFSGGSRSAFNSWLPKYVGGSVAQPSDAFFSTAASQDAWFKKSDKNASVRISALCAAGFEDAIRDFAALFGYDLLSAEQRTDETNPFFVYNTAKAIRKNVSVLLIAKDINEAVDRYLKDNGVMLLSDTCHALNSVIDGCDTPFIYEKTGSWLDHYLLDEFQDFSVVQWQNFRPLLRQSLDSGFSDLIVGDVKQSIYRWRGSDWNTLDNGLETDLEGGPLAFPRLETNRRSDEVIVNFNNDFFRWLSSSLDDSRIAGIYADCEQKSCKSGAGRVKVSFMEGGEDECPSLGALKGEIDGLLERGYSLKDIAVLVRRNSEADDVAAQLISDGISVITEESLKVGAAVSVRKVVSVLKSLTNSADARNGYLLSHLGVDVEALESEVKGRPLYDMCERIAMSLEGGVPCGELPYFAAFMDIVLDYVAQNGSDVAGFVSWWDESGSKETVSAPKSADAVRIMTIHKAKGLGMPVVIMPFFSERFRPGNNQTNYIWCSDASADLDAGLVPIEYSSALESSLFRKESLAEKQYYIVDAVNTAYVAFTRPEHELIVFAKKPKIAKNGEPASESVSDKLYKYLVDSGNLDENDLFEAGCQFDYKPERGDAPSSEEENAGIIRLERYESVNPEGSDPERPRIRLIGRGRDFFEKENARRRGIVMHDILSAISTADDIDGAVEEAVLRGEVAAEEAAGCASEIRAMVDSVSSYGWFAQGAKVLNEVSIIDADGTVVRPDRVIVSGDTGADAGAVTGGAPRKTAVVVDYKFGAPHPSHGQQVAGYMSLLSRMGYADVKGYIWYAAEGNIVPVGQE